MLRASADKRLSLEAVILIIFILALVSTLFNVLTVLYFSDIPVYESYSKSIWHGGLPYRDISIEYPPGVLPFILLPHLFGNYTVGFIFLSALALGFILWDQNKIRASRALLLITLLLPILPFVLFQLDIFAAVAFYAALRTFQQKKYTWSAITLALATLIKAYPIVCLPAFLLALPRKVRSRFLLWTGITLAVGVLPFLLISPSGFWHSITYHTGQPIQVESGPAALALILHAFGEPLGAVVSHKSLNFDFPLAHQINILSSVALAMGLILLTFFIKKRGSGSQLNLNCMAFLLIFIIFFKVGSPQFVVPLILAALLAIDQLVYKKALSIRLLAISLTLFLILFFDYRLTSIGEPLYTRSNWYAATLIILKFALLAELLIWTLRKLQLKTPASRKAL